MATDYALDKSTWTEEDFERMGWHDATVHALAFEPDSWEFFVDLDYILKWVEPDDDDKGYQFWVAPATMVFENVSGLKIDLEPLAALELNGIERTDPQSLDARAQRSSSSQESLNESDKEPRDAVVGQLAHRHRTSTPAQS